MAGVVAQSLWLALPVIAAGVLHMVVVKRGLFAALAVPLDGGRSLGGQPIFGPNKTVRGFVVMIALAALVGLAQGALGGAAAERSGLACLDFSGLGGSYAGGYALVNAVLGLGYVLGELPNSFLKRRIGITPGKTGASLVGALFFLLDQADSVLAALGLGLLAFGYPVAIFVVGSLVLTLVHLALNAALYLGKLRRNL